MPNTRVLQRATVIAVCVAVCVAVRYRVLVCCVMQCDLQSIAPHLPIVLAVSIFVYNFLLSCSLHRFLVIFYALQTPIPC